MAETVVQEVREQVKALDQSVPVLRRAPHEVSARSLASARGAESLDTSPADRCKEIRWVAREIVASVLESFGEHLVSDTSDAAEPGPAARQKLSELVAARASRAGKSGEERCREAEGAASNRASSQSSIDKATKEAVESVSSTLSSFVASQLEEDFSCEFSEIWELQGVAEGPGSSRAWEQQIPEASGREKLPVLQPLQNTADVSRESLKTATESTRKAISRAQQLDAELIGYAKTIVLEVVETVKKKLEEERKTKQKSQKVHPRKLLPPLSLPAIVPPSEEAGQLKEESSCTLLPALLRYAEQDARRPAEGLRKSQDYTPGAAAARSSVPTGETLCTLRPGSTTGTLPSTGPQLLRQPMPPAGPKPPTQAAARRRPARLKLVLAEPIQPETLKRAVAGNLVEGVLRRFAAPGTQSPAAARPGRE